jgi:flagellar biosynthetic protein FlhB
MAEQAGEKTLDATPHRRQQAREQGQVAYSQDLASAALLIMGVLLLKFWGGGVVDLVGGYMKHQLGTVGPLAAEQAELVARSHTLVLTLGKALLPIAGLLAVAGACSSIFQTGPLFVPQRLLPDWSRINPASGIKRIVSLSGMVRLGFGMFKVSVVAVVAATVLYQRRDEVLQASSLSTPELALLLADTALSTALWVGVALFVLALFDFAFQKWKHEQDLRMTRQEMLDEMKNLQGDPQIIARRKAIQRQMALHRMGEKVPKADVVVTNPTELAVAIQYDPEKMKAPIVVAKGAGIIAQRIRRLALEHNIPVVERKPLAQLLYKEVDVNHPIPDKSYAAVAEILAYVYQLKGKKLPKNVRAA